MTAQWPKAVLLDLDDTILAFESVADASWKVVLEKYADRIATAGFQAAFQSIKSSAREFWREPERHRKGRLDLMAACQTIIRDALLRQGFMDDDLVQQIAVGYDIARTAAIHPIPGAIETIEEMHNAGVKLTLITNGAASSQREKIERFRLEPFFDLILIEGERGYGKPDERIYFEALSVLDVAPSEAWMVGDNWAWEVVAPQRLGIRGIWVNSDNRPIPEYDNVKPFRTVRSLSELRTITIVAPLKAGEKSDAK